MRVVAQFGHVWAFAALKRDTIALDGAVQGPEIDSANRRFSFDHHGHCLRFCTTATCQQVLDAILLGLDPSGMTVLVNDIDADVVLSLWLLRHWDRWTTNAMELERVRPIVAVVGLADAHGPSYPSPDPTLLRCYHEVVLRPWRTASGAGYAMNLDFLTECVGELERWWQAGLPCTSDESHQGSSARVAVQEHDDWALVVSEGEEHDLFSTMKELYAAGHQRVVLARAGSRGRTHYTIGKKSDFVSSFSLEQIFEELNVKEVAFGGSPGWGGASSIGGSPRPQGSMLSVEQVVHVIQGRAHARK